MEPTSKLIKATVYALPIGAAFGFALEKSKVYLPFAIRSQMLFSNFVMLKVFLTATATGMILTAVMEKFGFTARVAKKQSLGTGWWKGYDGNVIGGVIMGAGIAIAGACPGTAMVQLGAGVQSAKYVIAGGLMAAGSFGYVHLKLYKATKGKFLERQDSLLLDKWANISTPVIALTFSSILFGMVYAVEKISPSAVDITRAIGNSVELSTVPSLVDIAWYPILSGLVIGCLQVPSVLIIGSHLGASGAYVTVVSNILEIVDKNLKKRFPYFSTFSGYCDYGQVGIVLGIGIGSFVSTLLSGALPVEDVFHSTPFTYFAGGFLMIFGSRIAGGCASGHGLSGMAKLSLASLTTVAGMFAGAIGASLILFK